MKSNRRWIIAFCLYFIILLTIILSAYLGVLPVKIDAIPFYDTFGHFILLGSASFFAHKALGMRTIKILGFLAIPLGPLLITLFAIVDEMLQALSPRRTCSLSDMSANLIGIWLFCWLASLRKEEE